jgi:hypothetical protein
MSRLCHENTYYRIRSLHSVQNASRLTGQEELCFLRDEMVLFNSSHVGKFLVPGTKYTTPILSTSHGMDPAEIVRGACSCGRITVSISQSALPKFTGICHCLNCKAASGSRFVCSFSPPRTPSNTRKIYGQLANSYQRCPN